MSDPKVVGTAIAYALECAGLLLVLWFMTRQR